MSVTQTGRNEEISKSCSFLFLASGYSGLSFFLNRNLKY